MELVLQDSKSIIDISENIFGLEFNEPLVHQVVVAYLAGARKGNSAQKNRSEVSGTGKKPWRQKGTGRARAGSIQSPIWRSGGVTFAAKKQNYSQKINKKMYKGALKSIFSELLRQNRLIIVENFLITEPKTKILSNKLKKMKLEKILIIIDKINKNLFLASQNLYKVYVCITKNIDPVSLISFDKVIITAKAINQVEDMLS